MSWTCPHCGFETALAPLTFKDRMGVSACPICDRVLPMGAAEHRVAKSLRWMGQENSELFDHLIDRMDRKAARRRTLRRIGVLAAVVLLALIVYLVVS